MPVAVIRGSSMEKVERMPLSMPWPRGVKIEVAARARSILSGFLVTMVVTARSCQTEASGSPAR